jgi:gamma-glutamyltranspeptidase/glutathione hydrolase
MIMLQEQVAFIVICMVMGPEPGFGADLSPAKWKADERARVVEGQQGLVAGTMSPIAVHAGMEAPRQGGTAADAAATVALTQIATALGSYVSYAGILELVYYDAKSGKATTMDAKSGAMRAAETPGVYGFAEAY